MPGRPIFNEKAKYHAAGTETIQAPIKKDDTLGKLKIMYKNELIDEYNLFAFEDVKKLNIFSRLIKSINFLIWGDV